MTTAELMLGTYHVHNNRKNRKKVILLYRRQMFARSKMLSKLGEDKGINALRFLTNLNVTQKLASQVIIENNKKHKERCVMNGILRKYYDVTKQVPKSYDLSGGRTEPFPSHILNSRYGKF